MHMVQPRTTLSSSLQPYQALELPIHFQLPPKALGGSIEPLVDIGPGGCFLGFSPVTVLWGCGGIASPECCEGTCKVHKAQRPVVLGFWNFSGYTSAFNPCFCFSLLLPVFSHLQWPPQILTSGISLPLLTSGIRDFSKNLPPGQVQPPL